MFEKEAEELLRNKYKCRTHEGSFISATKVIEIISDLLNAEERERQIIRAKRILYGFIDLKYKPCASGNSINMLIYENLRKEAIHFLKEE